MQLLKTEQQAIVVTNLENVLLSSQCVGLSTQIEGDSGKGRHLLAVNHVLAKNKWTFSNNPKKQARLLNAYLIAKKKKGGRYYTLFTVYIHSIYIQFDKFMYV